jgi:hypothetical protein
VAKQNLVLGRKRRRAGELFEWIAVVWHAKPFVRQFGVVAASLPRHVAA